MPREAGSGQSPPPSLLSEEALLSTSAAIPGCRGLISSPEPGEEGQGGKKGGTQSKGKEVRRKKCVRSSRSGEE